MSNVAPVTAVFVIRSTARVATSSGPTTRRIGRVRAELLAPCVEPVSEDRRGERRVDESRGDQVDADRGELEGEASRQRGHRGRDRGDERSGGRTPAACAAEQHQASGRLQCVLRQAGELNGQHDPFDASTDLSDVELRERARSADRLPTRARGGSGRGGSRRTAPAGPGSLRSNAEMLAPSSRPTRCSRSGSRAVRIRSAPSLASASGRLQPDPGATAEHHNGLAGELRLAAHAGFIGLTSASSATHPSEVQFRVPGLKASLHRRVDQALRFGAADLPGNRSESRRKSSDGASEIALTRSLIATWPAAGNAAIRWASARTNPASRRPAAHG